MLTVFCSVHYLRVIEVLIDRASKEKKCHLNAEQSPGRGITNRYRQEKLFIWIRTQTDYLHVHLTRKVVTGKRLTNHIFFITVR
jgi:hypothetical protein